MRSRRKWFFLLLAGIVLGIAAWNLTREREPVYDGKTLSQWLLYEPNIQSKGSGGWLIDERGIQHIGTNAIPFLLKWISTPPPTAWRIKIAEIFSKLPAPLSNESIVSSISGARAATLALCSVSAFRVLNSAAAPAVPGLTKLATSSNNEFIRNSAMLALHDIGRDAMPGLLAVYTSTDKSTRISIHSTIEVLLREPTDAAPRSLIVNYFNHPDALVRQGATNFAKDFAPELLTNTVPR